jgi:hypothetical protein
MHSSAVEIRLAAEERATDEVAEAGRQLAEIGCWKSRWEWVPAALVA